MFVNSNQILIMASVIIASVIMASVTYGKCIMANVIMAKVFMAKVLWQMKLSRLQQIHCRSFHFITPLYSMINSFVVCWFDFRLIVQTFKYFKVLTIFNSKIDFF